MFSLDNVLIQLWISSFAAMLLVGVAVSVWAAWRTITRQRSQLQSVNAELDLRVTELSTEISLRKQVEEDLADQAAALARADEVRRSRQRIIGAQESLRREIAQQIHGSVQNRLIVLLLRLKELEKAAGTTSMAGELEDLRKKFEDLLDNEIRSIVHQLYPYILRRGFVPALQSLGDQIESVMPIELELAEDLVQREKANRSFIPEPAKLAAYRIAEEALTNVVKHSKASKVTVQLEMPSEGWLRLTVMDDGNGFTADESSPGMGIVGMRDYAEAIGGECVIQPANGQGTRVVATIPLSTPEKGHLEIGQPSE